MTTSSLISLGKRQREILRPALFDVALLFAAFLLYTLTLTPSLLPADSGEFQLVAWKLGIAHPPGYPLYIVVGHLFSRFFASPAFALNVLSAILASITLVLVSRAVRAATGSTLGGLAAAVILATATTFWAQATTANIRMPTALFTAACVYVLVMHQQAVAEARNTAAAAPPRLRAGSPDRYLILFALLFSLGLSHHVSLIFPGIFFVTFVLLVDPSIFRQPRRWIRPGIAFLLGLLPLLYLPARGLAGGTLANGESGAELAQPDRFLDYVLARGFEGDFFYFVTERPDLLDDRLALLPTLFDFQFNLGALMLGLLGAVVLARRNWRLLVMLLGGIAAHTFVTLAYRAPQTVEYLMPAYVLFAILIGCSVGQVLTTETRTLGAQRFSLWFNLVLFVMALIAGLARGLDNLPSYDWLSRNGDTRAYAESLLEDAPPDAIILSNWHWANPMWYLQQVERLRADVDVVYVYPRGEPLAITWLKEIDSSVTTGRPVIVDMYFHEEFLASPYFFEPISQEAFLVRQSYLSNLPQGYTPYEAEFGGKFKLLGFRLLDERTTPGEPYMVNLAWRVESQPERDYSFFVHLVDSSGRVVGQADRTLPTMRYKPGDVIVERFFVAPLPGVLPDEYTLATGIYTVENTEIVELGGQAQFARTIVEPPVRLADQPTSAVALSHGIYFLNPLPYPRASALYPGSQLVLDLRFLASRPLTRDIVVSVQMIGEGYTWKTTADSVPALGAIPTLKWIAGSQVADRHVVDIPPDTPPGPATVSVILYDHFTQQPLALLDPQLIQQDRSIPLGAWTILPP
ncbi:MAG TPA: DUF2723 domain-containing protein [Anaerolineae bacterium]|nr:DUF2723 domain-containing protein [Anaerolineae bacterium]